jgi:TetR/AcrR family transcriptional regulator, transcriptional repressor for nem operon
MPASEMPPTAKGRATRARIVDAAADLMVSRGVAAVSLEDVRQLTDTSKSQLYHYFDSKEDLVVAVVDCVRARILSFQRPLLVTLDSFEALDRWAATIVQVQRQVGGRGGCPLGTLANELADSVEVARAELEAAFDEWERLLASGLAAMKERGELEPTADPAQLAVFVLASLQGGLLMAKTTQSVAPLEVALASSLGYVQTFSATRQSNTGAPDARTASDAPQFFQSR